MQENQEQWFGNGVDREMHLDPPAISPPAAPADYSHVIKTIFVWKDILNARLLALLALLGAMVMYGFAMYDPTSLRLTGVSLYSMGVLWPVIALFLRKG